MNTSFITKAISPSQSTMRSTVEQWVWNLVNSIIVGGSTAVVSALGLATAHGMGVQDIPQVNWHTIEVVFVSGAVSKLFIFLAQGLPALQSNNSNQNQQPPTP